MHQKIPQDFEKRGAGREGGDLCWYVRTRLIASLLGCLHQWKGGVGGGGGGSGALNLKRILKGTDGFNIQIQIL